MHGLASLVSLLLLTLSQSLVSASPCLSFDINFNLLAFGFGGKDYNAGTQDAWATAINATDITATGRPPFDGVGTTCFLAQFFNAIYVLNGDAKNPKSIYIYDATAKSWSTQVTTPGSFDYSSFNAILDHDTNLFYALSKGSLYGLDMGSLKSANSTPLAWNPVQKAPYPDGYNPVMALAQNHIHFLNVGSDGPGKARIYVIHYSYFQPEIQDYPGDKTFPAAHGQTASFFMPTGVQQEFAFIPDDFSGTYVVNVENNSTRTLPPPTVQDTKSTYVAGITSLLQLDSAGAVSFVPYTPGDNNANAAWSSVKSLAGLVASSNIRSNSTSNDQRNNNTNVPNNTQTSHSDAGGAPSGHSMASGLVGLAALFAILSFF